MTATRKETAWLARKGTVWEDRQVILAMWRGVSGGKGKKCSHFVARATVAVAIPTPAKRDNAWWCLNHHCPWWGLGKAEAQHRRKRCRRLRHRRESECNEPLSLTLHAFFGNYKKSSVMGPKTLFQVSRPLQASE